MPWFEFIWTDQIVEHLPVNHVTPEEFEEIVMAYGVNGTSRSSGRPTSKGETIAGRVLFCVFEIEDGTTIIPVTAYTIEE